MPRPEIGSIWNYGNCRLFVVGWSHLQGFKINLHHKRLSQLTFYIEEEQFNLLIRNGDIKRQQTTEPIRAGSAAHAQIEGWD